MRRAYLILANENGSVLLVSVLVLLLLTIIGIFATTTSTIEVQIAGNEKTHKMAFCAADGGTEVGLELVEQSYEEAGFDAARTDPYGADEFLVGSAGDGVAGGTLDLDMQKPRDPDTLCDSDRDAYYPANYAGNEPHTNLAIGGNPGLSTGSAIQMCAGYEGKGKSSAAGGAYKVFDVMSQHKGVNKSNAEVILQWRHVI